MKKLPTVKVRPVPVAQQERLRRWLHEWTLDRVLRDGKEGSGPVRVAFSRVSAETGAGVAPITGEAPVVAGQIRLISPQLAAGWRRPLYVAILCGGGERLFVAAPYGRFSEPVLPGELLSGREGAACLRVLCLWNAGAIRVDVIRESWVVDSLAAREMDEALAVYRSVTGGGGLPPDLGGRVGPPLIHPDDPRWEYQREERSLMTELTSGARVAEDAGDAGLVWPGFTPEDRGLPKAAEPETPYGG